MAKTAAKSASARRKTGPAKATRRPARRGRRGPDPARLTAAELARLLRVPAEAVRRHLDAGAPADPDGRIGVVPYAAWLNQQRMADGH